MKRWLCYRVPRAICSLHLHPEDAQLVHELLPASDSETQWHIIEDVSVGRGGCRVATDTSQVDATVGGASQ